MNTRGLILKRALELFNEKGIEYTGVRELAVDLGIRVSNISYYFPGKDDLVAALAAELQELNNATHDKLPGNSMNEFLAMRWQSFHNQYKYRCLLLSMVHLVVHNPMHSKNYSKTEKKRFDSIYAAIKALRDNGYLLHDVTGERERILTGHISLLSRFWISEARITYPDKKEDEVIRHYMLQLCDILSHHVTAKGKKEISMFTEKHLK